MNPDATPEEKLADELHALRMPSDLLPPPASADLALQRVRARRGRRALAAVVAVFAVLTAASLTLSGTGGGSSADPSPSGSASGLPTAPLPDSQVPHPGGGPRVMEFFNAFKEVDGEEVEIGYLLDRSTGKYMEVPFATLPSPDGRYVAVRKHERLDPGIRWGVADRAEYLRRGEAAVTWRDFSGVYGYTEPVDSWSPDSTKITTAWFAWDMGNDKNGTGIVVSELRTYDMTTGNTTVTKIPANVDIASLCWRPDGSGFVVTELVSAGEQLDAKGQIRTLSLDGQLGAPTPLADEARSGGSGAFVLQGYSPDRRFIGYTYRTANSESMGGVGGRLAVLDATTFQPVSAAVNIDWDDYMFTSDVSWYDATTLMRTTQRGLNPGTQGIELVDAVTGAVKRTIPWSGGSSGTVYGPCTGLPADAGDLCF